MPGFDRTGPLGEGEMTGGGRGYCIEDAEVFRRRATGLRRFAAFGRGLRPGRGMRSPAERRHLGLGYRRGWGRWL